MLARPESCIDREFKGREPDDDSGVVNMYHGYPEADVNILIEPNYLDPISAYPGFKALLCEVKKIS